LQDAVKLKSAQMGQKRKQYETWPFFVQHTLFHSEKDEFKAWRLMPFDEKIEVSERLKEEGNTLYKEKKYSDAVDKYEEAPSLFHYCYSNDPGWRKNNRGIDDDVLVLVDETGADEDEAAQIKKLRLSCCLNIAQCKLKLAKFDEAVKACDTALELDPENIKALYRRAEARVRPSGATAYDHDCAIKDLNKASEIDPDDKNVTSLLKTLREERKKQRTKDKGTFEGMFSRGEIYDKESMEEAEAKKLLSNTTHRWEGLPNDKEMNDLKQRIEDVADDDPLEKRIADAELLRDLYERNDKQEEAQKLNDQIQAAKKAVKEQQEQRTSRLDFSNPTPEMIADAEKYGLDLTDPLVQAELRRIENEDPEALAQELDEDIPPPAPAAAEIPLPEAPEYVPVPWMRYVLLFGGFILLLRSYDVYFLVLKLIAVLSRLLSAPDLGDDPGAQASADTGPSAFARAYQLLFAPSNEESEF
jgi:tetratricopeptide (TPR) repeat protein